MIDTHRLRVWRAVVASGSVQGAARHLGYTPSTVSQHIQQLQRETKLVLTERVGRGLRPTPAGLALAAEGDEVLQALQRLEAVVADLREGRAHELAISCFASVAHEWIPDLARKLQEELPGLVLEVSINEPHEGTGRRTPDIAVRSQPLNGEANPPEGHIRHDLCTEEFVVVLPKNSPLAAGDTVRMADLADAAWIDNVVYEDSPTLHILLEGCRAAGFTPRWIARCDDHLAATRLVGAGVGVTAFPALAAGIVPTGAVTRTLVDPTPQRQIVAWQRTATAHSTASELAVQMLRHIASN